MLIFGTHGNVICLQLSVQRKKSVHICSTSRRGGKYKYVSKMNVTSRTFVNTRLVFIRESSGGKFR